MVRQNTLVTPRLSKNDTLANIEKEEGKMTRMELVEAVRKSGIRSSSKKKSPLLQSLSEPSSPRKLYRGRKNTFDDDLTDSSSCSSMHTITSEDGLNGSRELPRPREHTIPSLVVSQEDDIDSFMGGSGEFRQRTGSQFYQDSFSNTSGHAHRPCLYLPTTPTAQMFTFSGRHQAKKQKGLFNRLRHSFNKHKSFISDKGQHHRQSKQRKWVDHEEELDPVSRPSYFRHIGHVIRTGPGVIRTIQLNKPSQGKFGVYVAQGVGSDSPHSKSVFVTKFYQENLSMFYSSLLRPGDEILAINDRSIRDVPIARVERLLAKLDTVQLTVMPSNQPKDS